MITWIDLNERQQKALTLAMAWNGVALNLDVAATWRGLEELEIVEIRGDLFAKVTPLGKRVYEARIEADVDTITWNDLTEAQQATMRAIADGMNVNTIPFRLVHEGLADISMHTGFAVLTDLGRAVYLAGNPTPAASISSVEAEPRALPPLEVLEREGGSFSVYRPMNGAHYVVYDSLDHKATPVDETAALRARIVQLEAALQSTFDLLEEYTPEWYLIKHHNIIAWALRK